MRRSSAAVSAPEEGHVRKEFLERSVVREELVELILCSSGDDRTHHGAHGGPGEDPRQQVVAHERSYDSDVESPERAAAAQQQRSAAEAVARLLEKRKLLFRPQVHLGGYKAELSADLLDVLADWPRHALVLGLVEPPADIRDVAEIAEQVRTQSKHHLALKGTTRGGTASKECSHEGRWRSEGASGRE